MQYSNLVSVLFAAASVASPAPAPPPAWVGIDGAQSACQTLLQAGKDFTLIDGDSGYGFYPGDTVYVKIAVTSSKTGTAYMLNNSTGKFTTIQLQDLPGSQLRGSNVEWIQENAGGNAAKFVLFDSLASTIATLLTVRVETTT
ncbi:hypothetical protein PWT90_00991 [Aphanocladium album]|nr:hypothetical protein PWT90_00991 [Aphanocladium album]